MKRFSIPTILLTIVAFINVSATIIYIPGDYPAIQQGIDASINGDTVLVQPGTYYENINFNGHNIVLGSLFLTTGDTSYIEQTDIDGDTAGSVVTFENGEDNSAVITGFSIQNGSSALGGGMRILNADPSITYNIIKNSQSNRGGGIACVNSNPLILRNRIINNSVYNDQEGYGGGILCSDNSNPYISNNRIISNHAYGTLYGEGGGICCQSNSSPTIVNNLIISCSVGGANRGAGGGISGGGDSLYIVNNTIAYNHIAAGIFPSEGGGIRCLNISTTIINNIVWGNSYDDLYGPFTVSYCNVQDTLWPGVGNMSILPAFRYPEISDYHLKSLACGDSLNSPCIDAGDPNILDSLLDCSWGLGDLRSDMGAYGGGDSGTVDIIYNDCFLPNKIALLQNYPNPFNSGTIIRFSIVRPVEVRLAVYDILGREVQTPIDEYKQAGIHTVTFNATNLPSGVYFYCIQAGNVVETKRMVILK